MRRLAAADLWIQDNVATGEITLCKVKGAENPADILTKHVEGSLLQTHKVRLGLEQEGGRAASAAAVRKEVAKALFCSAGCFSSKPGRKGGVLNRRACVGIIC